MTSNETVKKLKKIVYRALKANDIRAVEAGLAALRMVESDYKEKQKGE